MFEEFANFLGKSVRRFLSTEFHQFKTDPRWLSQEECPWKAGVIILFPRYSIYLNLVLTLVPGTIFVPIEFK